MPTLSWTTTVQMSGRPTTIVARAAAPIEANDYAGVTLAPGDADITVALQPSAAERVRLLIITSDRYGDDLTFKVSDGAGETDPITLDEPQVFAGGAIALFELDPNRVIFTNASGDEPANVDVYAYREAAP
jgi:hypothetical protein